MRLTAASSARAAPFDRNPLLVGQGYFTQAVAPHGQTTRWSYTVPTGRRAQVGSLDGMIVRDGAATTVGYAAAQVYYLVGGSGQFFYCLQRATFSIAANSQSSGGIGQGPYLKASDQLIGATMDASIGGTNTYSLGATITEFDV